MNNLLIIGHPNPNSFNAAIKDRIVEVGEQKGWITVVRDLYSMNFDPILSGKDIVGFKKGIFAPEIAEEHKHFEWADMITLVYPLWWAGLPAIMKGYLDRVLSYGFAYKYDNNGKCPLLANKKAFMVCTLGEDIEFYERIGMIEALNKTSDFGIFGFCGTHVVDHLYFGSVSRVTPEERAEYLNRVEKVLHRIK